MILSEAGFTDIEVGQPVDTFGGANGEAIVRQLKPDGKLSRQSFSNRRVSSATGKPYSRSW